MLQLRTLGDTLILELGDREIRRNRDHVAPPIALRAAESSVGVGFLWLPIYEGLRITVHRV